MSWQDDYRRNPQWFNELFRQWHSWNIRGHSESLEQFRERGRAGVHAYIHRLPQPPIPSPPPIVFPPPSPPVSPPPPQSPVVPSPESPRQLSPPPSSPPPSPEQSPEGSSSSSPEGSSSSSPESSPPPPPPHNIPPPVPPPSEPPVPHLWTVFMYRWHHTVPMLRGETQNEYRTRAVRRMQAMCDPMSPAHRRSFAFELAAWREWHSNLPTNSAP